LLGNSQAKEKKNKTKDPRYKLRGGTSHRVPAARKDTGVKSLGKNDLTKTRKENPSRGGGTFPAKKGPLGEKRLTGDFGETSGRSGGGAD